MIRSRCLFVVTVTVGISPSATSHKKKMKKGSADLLIQMNKTLFGSFSPGVPKDEVMTLH